MDNTKKLSFQLLMLITTPKLAEEAAEMFKQGALPLQYRFSAEGTAENSEVFGTVTENGKGKKVIIFKYKSKKDYRKKQGHRQPYTMVEITGLGTDKPAKAAPKAEATETVTEAKKPAKSLKSMKKAELIEFAKENGIELDEKATNAIMIETIEAALK